MKKLLLIKLYFLSLNKLISCTFQQSAFHEAFTELNQCKIPFDCQKQLEPFYSDVMLEYLSKTFSTGKYSGGRLIDIGTGPTLHSVISASSHFEDIIVTEFTNQDCQTIEKWINKEAGHLNLSSAIQYVHKLEARRSPAHVEQELRQKVKVLKSDLHLENLFEPITVGLADCVITSLCFDPVCDDPIIHFQTLNNVTSLLRPWGTLVMVGVQLDSDYMMKNIVVLGREQVLKDILSALWFHIIEFNIVVNGRGVFVHVVTLN